LRERDRDETRRRQRALHGGADTQREIGTRSGQPTLLHREPSEADDADSRHRPTVPKTERTSDERPRDRASQPEDAERLADRDVELADLIAEGTIELRPQRALPRGHALVGARSRHRPRMYQRDRLRGLR
jgi:hypothetical protein